jgi:hypothetical protein
MLSAGGGHRVAAGYSTSYGGDSVHKNSTGFVFMTIKGSGHEVPTGEKQIRGSGGSLEPPGPLPMHLHTAYMEYSECLLTLLNHLAESTCFSQVPTYKPAAAYTMFEAFLNGTAL